MSILGMLGTVSKVMSDAWVAITGHSLEVHNVPITWIA